MGAIEEAKVYCSSHSDCGGFAVSQFWESFCPQFFSLNPTTYDNSAWTFFVKSEEVVTSMVQFTTSDSGDNCDNACEAIGEECIEDMLFLQSAEEFSSWSLEVGVACSQILDRCDIGESPIFLEDDGVCTFCSNPNHPGWDNGNRCGAQWDIRQRICPCTSTLAEFTSTTTPEESTTELPDDYVSLMDSHSYDYSSHGNHQCDSYSDSRDVAIEEAKVYCSSHSDCGGFAVSQVWESFCPQFFSLNPTTYDNSAWTFFVKSEKENSNAFDGFTFITKDQGPADCGEFIGCDYGDEALQMQWCTETNCDLIQWCPANGEGLMSP